MAMASPIFRMRSSLILHSQLFHLQHNPISYIFIATQQTKPPHKLITYDTQIYYINNMHDNNQ